MSLDAETKAAVLNAIKRVFEGRETVPGDLPYPSVINGYVLLAVDPAADPRRMELTADGRRISRAVRQVYLAGYFAGRACDEQIGAQVRAALGITWNEREIRPHPYVGVAVCIVCDLAPDDPVHGVTP